VSFAARWIGLPVELSKSRSEKVQEMMRMMEGHNKLKPEDCFGENVNSSCRLIVANAR
jgi:hypothetical protein